MVYHKGLFFRIYINDLQFVSDVLDPVMFASDTSLFYSQKDTNALFLKVNNERSKEDDIPLLLPKLKINNCEIRQAESIKFLGVLLVENLTRKPHIKYIKNKIAKNIGLLFKDKSFLNKQSLLSIYYSHIHSYINYDNVAWGST